MYLIRPQSTYDFLFCFHVLAALVIFISCFTDFSTGEFSQRTLTHPCLLFSETGPSIRWAEAGT